MELHRVTVTPLKSNCYILKSGTDIAVVDPGGDPEKILQRLAKLDGQVKFIIATHYHFDHVGALKELKESVSAPFLIHKNDVPFLDNIIPDQTLTEGDEISLGEETLQVIHTPGTLLGAFVFLETDSYLPGHVIPVFLWKNRLSWRRRFSDAAISKKASGHTCAGHDRVSRTWVAFCHQKLGDKSGQFAFLGWRGMHWW